MLIEERSIPNTESVLTTCFRKGGERKTLQYHSALQTDEPYQCTRPKKAIAHDHKIALPQLIFNAGEPSSSTLRRVKAGRMPTYPAANGI